MMKHNEDMKSLDRTENEFLAAYEAVWPSHVCCKAKHDKQSRKSW